MKRDFIRWQVLMERDLDQRVRLLLLAKRISLSEYVRRLVERILNFAEFFMLILLVTEHIT